MHPLQRIAGSVLALTAGWAALLASQVPTHPAEYGRVRGGIVIDMRSLSTRDTLWMGTIMAYSRASEAWFGFTTKDSTGKFTHQGPMVKMVVHHDSTMTVVPHCEIDSSGASDSVIALAPYAGQDDFMGKVQRAWIVSRTKRRFVPFPARRVRCENPFLD